MKTTKHMMAALSKALLLYSRHWFLFSQFCVVINKEEAVLKGEDARIS